MELGDEGERKMKIILQIINEYKINMNNIKEHILSPKTLTYILGELKAFLNISYQGELEDQECLGLLDLLIQSPAISQQFEDVTFQFNSKCLRKMNPEFIHHLMNILLVRAIYVELYGLPYPPL
jgi:hypothetical protein